MLEDKPWREDVVYVTDDSTWLHECHRVTGNLLNGKETGHPRYSEVRV